MGLNRFNQSLKNIAGYLNNKNPTYAPDSYLENELTNQELTSISSLLPTSTTRKIKTRTTRTRLTRSSSSKPKTSTKTSSNSDWLFLTNTESTILSHNIVGTPCNLS